MKARVAARAYGEHPVGDCSGAHDLNDTEFRVGSRFFYFRIAQKEPGTSPVRSKIGHRYIKFTGQQIRIRHVHVTPKGVRGTDAGNVLAPQCRLRPPEHLSTAPEPVRLIVEQRIVDFHSRHVAHSLRIGPRAVSTDPVSFV